MTLNPSRNELNWPMPPASTSQSISDDARNKTFEGLILNKLNSWPEELTGDFSWVALEGDYLMYLNSLSSSLRENVKLLKQITRDPFMYGKKNQPINPPPRQSNEPPLFLISQPLVPFLYQCVMSAYNEWFAPTSRPLGKRSLDNYITFNQNSLMSCQRQERQFTILLLFTGFRRSLAFFSPSLKHAYSSLKRNKKSARAASLWMNI